MFTNTIHGVTQGFTLKHSKGNVLLLQKFDLNKSNVFICHICLPYLGMN